MDREGPVGVVGHRGRGERRAVIRFKLTMAARSAVSKATAGLTMECLKEMPAVDGLMWSHRQVDSSHGV